MTGSDARVQQIRDWLTSELDFRLVRLEPASADASFRRYFRAWGADGLTRVVMDAPPDKEDIGPFLKVAALLEACEVHVPHIHAADGDIGHVENFLTAIDTDDGSFWAYQFGGEHGDIAGTTAQVQDPHARINSHVAQETLGDRSQHGPLIL